MQGTNATICGISLEEDRTSSRGARPFVLGAVIAATVGCVAAYVVHVHSGAAPTVANASSEASLAQAARLGLPSTLTLAANEDPAKLFGAIIVEPEWRAQAAATTEPPPVVASLTPEPHAASGVSVPPPAESTPVPPAAPPATANLLPDAVPLPPVRDVPLIDDTAPLPPARPPEFAEPAPNFAAPERRVAQPVPEPAPAPANQPNIIQRLLGLGEPSGSAVASRPAAPPVAPALARPTAAPAPAASPETTVATRPSGDGRSGLAGLFSAFSSHPSLDRLGYDRQTAIYDISARAVYLPDGTRLEAHSGLGAALDDLRYVSERAVGPTPPHLYQLTMRESLFHGVQALRLTPVGDGGVYGRAGLLAHPYMLGPNGDSNGCVSVKDYEAFLRAYEAGQITKLAVVSRL